METVPFQVGSSWKRLSIESQACSDNFRTILFSTIELFHKDYFKSDQIAENQVGGEWGVSSLQDCPLQKTPKRIE